MSRQRIWITASLCLAAIWSLVAVVMKKTDDQVSWPTKVLGLMEEAPWLNGAPLEDSKRRQYLADVMMNMQRLDAGQRRNLREDGQESMNRFFESLSDEEQKEYVNRLIEPLLDVIDQGLKAMPAEERKRIVARMRSDTKGMRGIEPPRDRIAEQDREFVDSLVAEDPILFLREASVKQKLELAPILEDMQLRVRGLRR
jgi:hypothetical protein